jgi:glycerol-3-phosphate dehydrogenase
MFGVRYTTRGTRRRSAVDAVFRALGHETPPPCRTAETPLHGGSISRMDTFLRAVGQRDVDGIPAATLKRIATTYGTWLRPRPAAGAETFPRLSGSARPLVRLNRRRNPLCGARRKWP